MVIEIYLSVKFNNFYIEMKLFLNIFLIIQLEIWVSE